MEVLIDDVLYVPKTSVEPVTDEKLQRALRSLTEIQYFSDCAHKHRTWAWEALNALAPKIAQLAANNPGAAFNAVKEN